MQEPIKLWNKNLLHSFFDPTRATFQEVSRCQPKMSWRKATKLLEDSKYSRWHDIEFLGTLECWTPLWDIRHQAPGAQTPFIRQDWWQIAMNATTGMWSLDIEPIWHILLLTLQLHSFSEDHWDVCRRSRG